MRTVLIGALVFGMMAAPAFAETVTVTLTGVKAQGGSILASLQTKDEFLQPKGHYGAIVAAPKKDGTVVVTIGDVAPGEYSLSVMHDADDNKQMKSAADGRPLEGWAMNNGSKLRGMPTWDDVKFTVGRGPVAITEAMIYPQQ